MQFEGAVSGTPCFLAVGVIYYVSRFRIEGVVCRSEKSTHIEFMGNVLTDHCCYQINSGFSFSSLRGLFLGSKMQRCFFDYSLYKIEFSRVQFKVFHVQTKMTLPLNSESPEMLKSYQIVFSLHNHNFMNLRK